MQSHSPAIKNGIKGHKFTQAPDRPLVDVGQDHRFDTGFAGALGHPGTIVVKLREVQMGMRVYEHI